MSVGSKLAKLIPAAEMTSGKVLVVTNMKPRKLAGVLSEGMILAATTPTAIKLLRVPSCTYFSDTETKSGSRIYLEGQAQFNNTEEQLNPKKDVLQRCLSTITIDKEGVARFNGKRLLAG